jgi:hypothetical protein
MSGPSGVSRLGVNSPDLYADTSVPTEPVEAEGQSIDFIETPPPVLIDELLHRVLA